MPEQIERLISIWPGPPSWKSYIRITLVVIKSFCSNNLHQLLLWISRDFIVMNSWYYPWISTSLCLLTSDFSLESVLSYILHCPKSKVKVREHCVNFFKWLPVKFCFVDVRSQALSFVKGLSLYLSVLLPYSVSLLKISFSRRSWKKSEA